MPTELLLRLVSQGSRLEVPATLDGAAAAAAPAFHRARAGSGVHLLLDGDRPYAVTLAPPVAPAAATALRARMNQLVTVVFAGRSPVRRKLAEAAGLDAPPHVD